MDTSSITVAKEVDARGTACPGPLLDAKRAVGEVPSGEVMQVLSSDEGTINDLKRWSKKMKHEYLGDQEEDGYWSIYLRMK
jgi:tRNA 2-thiouridine synthesizing protein A